MFLPLLSETPSTGLPLLKLALSPLVVTDGLKIGIRFQLWDGNWTSYGALIYHDPATEPEKTRDAVVKIFGELEPLFIELGHRSFTDEEKEIIQRQIGEAVISRWNRIGHSW